MNSALLFVHALSPLHAGTGQSVGAVDLAIARDRATGFPYLPGTSLKGSLRDHAKAKASESRVFLFGPEREKASDHAGALIFGDANLLFLPVRSVAGTFAWVTSPYLLNRFARDLKETGSPALPADLPTPQSSRHAVVARDSSLKVTSLNKVVFEDLDFEIQDHLSVGTLGGALGGIFKGLPESTKWVEWFSRRLCIVHDDVMSFLSQHATDVVARVAIDDEMKTVMKGALWYEESLPSETILVSLVAAVPNGRTKLGPNDCLDSLKKIIPADASIQLGGKASVGRGRCRLVFVNGGGK